MKTYDDTVAECAYELNRAFSSYQWLSLMSMAVAIAAAYNKSSDEVRRDLSAAIQADKGASSES